ADPGRAHRPVHRRRRQVPLRRRRGLRLWVALRRRRGAGDAPGPHHTPRVATTGGTAAARSAGASTASWPSSHRTIAPTARYHGGRRGTSKNFIRPTLIAIASAVPSTTPNVTIRKFSAWK